MIEISLNPSRGDRLSLSDSLRMDNLMMNEVKRARFFGDMPGRMLIKRKLSIGHNRRVRFDGTDTKKRNMFACPYHRKLDLPKLCRFEYPKGRDNRRRNIYGANVEHKLLIYIVDHNFTTIFRQPDGSAG